MVKIDIDLPDKCENCPMYLGEEYNDDPNDDAHCCVVGCGILPSITQRPAWCPLIEC